MDDKKNQVPDENSTDENELINRREFFVGLKKWSKVVIGGAIAGSAIANANQEALAATWVNRRGGPARGGSWANRSGGGGWVNRRGGGGAGWINR